MLRNLTVLLALLSLTGCMSVVGAIAELPLAAGKMAVSGASTVTEAAVTTTINVAGSAAGTVAAGTGAIVAGGSSSDDTPETVEVKPAEKPGQHATGN